MVYSQGSAFMANGGASIRNVIDAAQKKEADKLNRLRKKLDQQEQKRVECEPNQTQTAIEQIVAFAQLGQAGDMQGSLAKGRNTGKYRFRLLETRVLPMPPISAVSKKTPRRIKPSAHVFTPIELPPGSRFSSGPVDQPLNPVLSKE